MIQITDYNNNNNNNNNDNNNYNNNNRILEQRTVCTNYDFGFPPKDENLIWRSLALYSSMDPIEIRVSVN